MLRASRQWEQEAEGATRREAFRVGRAILSGLLSAGYAARTVADVLGVTADTVRRRAQAGALDVGVVAVLCGEDPAALDGRSRGLGIVPQAGALHSAELVALLIEEPRTHRG